MIRMACMAMLGFGLAEGFWRLLEHGHPLIAALIMAALLTILAEEIRAA